jgi:3-hydroxymyristoyl/3-hydroxydecanoyl-(acyl carrier protein) dehydratase
MKEKWHSIAIKPNTVEKTIQVEAKIPPESPWFIGHFPNDPIVPGIALISLVVDAVKYYEEKRDNPIRISGVKRVRFKKALRPDDLLSITINQENKGQNLVYSFKVLLKEEIACTGIISVEQLP